MDIRKILLVIVSGILFVSPALVPVPAMAGFGVSPGGFFYDHLKPGAEFEETVVLSRSDPDEDLNIVIEPDLGEMNEWFQFIPGKAFIFKKGEKRYSMKVRVKVPPGTVIKEYTGNIRIKSSSTEKTAGVAVVKGARMEVKLVATKLDFTDLLVRRLQIGDILEGQPISLKMLIENRGNTNAAPTRVVMELQKMNQEVMTIMEAASIESVPANKTKEVLAKFVPDVPVNPGNYFGVVKVYLGEKILRNERIAFELVTKPQVDLTKKKKESPAGFLGGIDTGNPMVTVVAVLAMAGLTMFLMPKVSSIKDKKKKLLLMAVIGLGWAAVAMLMVSGKNTPAKPTQQAGPGSSVSPTASPSGAVQGETIKRKVNNAEPVSVIDPSGLVQYNIYEKPDTASMVIYQAQEDENFSVIEEQARWFRVILPNGTDGWLPKSNVKR